MHYTTSSSTVIDFTCKVTYLHLLDRALGRILMLPIIFERAPVIQKMLFERLKPNTREPSRHGVQVLLRIPGGGPGGNAPGSSGVLAILNE